MRQNVVLLVLDTARADVLEPYGAPRHSSPVIADLARRGTVVESAYATASWTLPSHASMFTGLLPRTVGVFDLPEGTPLGAWKVMAPHRDRVLPEVLRRAGFATAGVSTNLWVSDLSGFGGGFDSFRFIDSGRQWAIHRDDPISRLRWDLEGLRAHVDDGAERALEALVGLGAPSPGEPFFWFVNLVECHSPYLPPRPYNDLGPIDRVRVAEEARRYLTLGAIWMACAGALEVPGEALDRMRHLYSRSVRLLDDWVGRLLDLLDRWGVLEETLVIVTSDHGENFGEDGYMGHAFSLDERLIHVPLVIAGPGAPPDPGVFSLARLPALIAAATGLDRHPWGANGSTEGVAVAQFEPPAPIDHPQWQQAIADWGADRDVAERRVGMRLTCATDGRLKVQLRGEAEELYDLETDPLELAPLPANSADAEAVARLRRGIEAAAVEPRGQPPPAPASADPPRLSEGERQALEDRMRLLGYM